MQKSKLVETVKSWQGIVIKLALCGALIFGPNYAFNTRKIITPTSIGESKVKGMWGHTEYVIHSNGSQEFKSYSSVGHKYGSSTFGLDIEGDGKIDVLRINGSELGANRFKDSLIRSLDYSSNKKKFDEADIKLEELRSQYFSK